MACFSSDHICYQYMHMFHSFHGILLRANCCFDKVCKHKGQAQPGYKAACLSWRCDLHMEKGTSPVYTIEDEDGTQMVM